MAGAQKLSSQLTLSSEAPAEYKKLSDVPEEKLLELKKEDPKQYAKLYKAEYGIELS